MPGRNLVEPATFFSCSVRAAVKANCACCSSFVMRAITPSTKGRGKRTASTPNGPSSDASKASFAAATSRSASAQFSQKGAICGIAAGFVARMSSINWRNGLVSAFQFTFYDARACFCT